LGKAYEILENDSIDFIGYGTYNIPFNYRSAYFMPEKDIINDKE